MIFMIFIYLFSFKCYRIEYISIEMLLNLNNQGKISRFYLVADNFSITAVFLPASKLYASQALTAALFRTEVLAAALLCFRLSFDLAGLQLESSAQQLRFHSNSTQTKWGPNPLFFFISFHINLISNLRIPIYMPPFWVAYF